MLLQTLILLAGLLLILVGANYLVEGSSSIARKSGISEFVIGLTIVGIGTSTPEMVVSFMSALKGNADMAVGNIVGSNIFNTFLILGVTALIAPMTITKTNLKRDIPMNIIATILLICLGMNLTVFGLGSNTLGRIDGAILLLVFAYYMYVSFKKEQIPHQVRDDSPHNPEQESHLEHQESHPELGSGSSSEEEHPHATWLSIVMVLGGLAGLIFGGRLFVDSASALAKMFNVPDAFIAITVMAGGTSMPELATCVVAALKGKGQLALGNILGSNISNILLILGGSSLIRPLTVEGITGIDMGMVLLAAIFLLASAYLFSKKKLDRVEGVILLLIELAYFTYLVINL